MGLERSPLVTASAPVPKALTIAGSDSGAGAGVQADLKTFAALGVYGSCAITAVTAQNTLGLQAIEPVSLEMVSAQIESVMADIGADAVKIGMLATRQIVEVVARELRRFAMNIVLDPVLVSSSGKRLLSEDALTSLRRELLPAALIMSPNLGEARTLADSDASPAELARRLHDLGTPYVLITGINHADPGAQSIDLFFDGVQEEYLEGPWISTPHTHGTGCTLSAALAAHLASGAPVLEAARSAKAFVTAALQRAYPIGGGHSPLNHFAGARVRSAE